MFDMNMEYLEGQAINKFISMPNFVRENIESFKSTDQREKYGEKIVDIVEREIEDSQPQESKQLNLKTNSRKIVDSLITQKRKLNDAIQNKKK